MNLRGLENTVMGIPIVENLKIRGHFFGMNKMICDYQNYYSKLGKMDKIITMWRQRTLTIIGKNLLINSLMSSLFLFNAQIENPPTDFKKLVEAKNRSFLWDGGVSKISHDSLIGDYTQGGIRYKDIDSFILSVNMKFLFRIKSNELSNSTCLPRFWMLRMFGIPQQCNNAEQRYHKNFFCHSVDILQCNFKLPKKDNWKGHPFYWDLLVALEKLQVENEPNSFESVMSTSLWYNRDLGSTFNVDLANEGINFIRDLFYKKKR